jgi:DNA-binding PucR family transcriptional regulator
VVVARPEHQRSKIAALERHDEQRGSEFVATLRAYLDAFGDVTVAAKLLAVHPNTLRYRLDRITRLADLNLDDPDERLVLALELRLR